MKMIVAVNNGGFIGKDGKLMWKSKEDFKHFKAKTMGGILIMGKRTFEEDLKGRQLPGRTTLVVGTGYLTLWQAVEQASILRNIPNFSPGDHELPLKDIWVCGGASIYKQLLPLCEEIHMSIIDNDQVGDRQFIVPESYRGIVSHYYFKPDNYYIVKEDNICPVSKQPCDDECCPPGAVCNLKPGDGTMIGDIPKQDNGTES